MKEDKLTKLLYQLAAATHEHPRPGFAQEIKDHIPPRLIRHRVSWDSVSIAVDLRMSKITAAAIILISIVVLSGLFRFADGSSESLYQDSRLLLKYGFGGVNAGRSDLIESLTEFYQDLTDQGRDVTFYGESADPKDNHAVLMHWKLANGDYRIIFNDLSARTVSPSALIRLQSRMIEKRLKK